MPSTVLKLTRTQITALWYYQVILTKLKGNVDLIPVPDNKIWCSPMLRNKIQSGDEHYRLFRFYTNGGLYAELVLVGYLPLGLRRRRLNEGNGTEPWRMEWDEWLDSSWDPDIFTTASISLREIYDIFAPQLTNVPAGSLAQIEAALAAAGIADSAIGGIINSVRAEHKLLGVEREVTTDHRAQQYVRQITRMGYELTREDALAIEGEINRFLAIPNSLLPNPSDVEDAAE